MEKKKPDFSKFKDMIVYINQMKLYNSDLLQGHWDRSPKFIAMADEHGMDRFALRHELCKQEMIKISGDGVRPGSKFKM